MNADSVLQNFLNLSTKNEVVEINEGFSVSAKVVCRKKCRIN